MASALPDYSADGKSAIDGHALFQLVRAAARAVEANRQSINELNVFPVPDGDTGTNMLLTLRSALDQTAASVTGHAARDTTALARAVLLSARGNSGLILAQFFKGLASGLDGAPLLDGRAFASGLRVAARNAYASVPDPKEGTMLTVFRECADAAEEEAARTSALADVLRAAAVQARDTTSRTPSMLEVLRQAGVVDSGGYGFTVMLEGALDLLSGSGDGAATYAPPAAIANGHVLAGHVAAGFAAQVAAEAWGFCTSFAITGAGLDPDAVRQKVNALGRSAVVAGDDRILKVHVHVADPDVALKYGATLGTVSNVEVANMDKQTGAQAKAWAAAPSTSAKLDVAIVAVVVGDGMAALFRATGLGACTVVPGGDSMNPSTADLVSAVEAAGADCVVLLPNNKNVVGTAQQVAALTRKQVRVIPTRSMQSGVAALLGYSPGRGLEQTARDMAAAAADVTSIAVTRATRDITSDGVRVRLGDFIAIVGDEIKAAGNRAVDVLADAAAMSATAGGIVTVYYGAGVSLAEAEAAAETLRGRLHGTEVELVSGGQPHYDYLAAVE